MAGEVGQGPSGRSPDDSDSLVMGGDPEVVQNEHWALTGKCEEERAPCKQTPAVKV